MLAERGGSSVWLDGLSGLSGSSGEVFGPVTQTDETGKMGQIDRISSDARNEGRSGSSLGKKVGAEKRSQGREA